MIKISLFTHGSFHMQMALHKMVIPGKACFQMIMGLILKDIDDE